MGISLSFAALWGTPRSPPMSRMGSFMSQPLGATTGLFVTRWPSTKALNDFCSEATKATWTQRSVELARDAEPLRGRRHARVVLGRGPVALAAPLLEVAPPRLGLVRGQRPRGELLRRRRPERRQAPRGVEVAEVHEGRRRHGPLRRRELPRALGEHALHRRLLQPHAVGPEPVAARAVQVVGLLQEAPRRAVGRRAPRQVQRAEAARGRARRPRPRARPRVELRHANAQRTAPMPTALSRGCRAISSWARSGSEPEFGPRSGPRAANPGPARTPPTRRRQKGGESGAVRRRPRDAGSRDRRWGERRRLARGAARGAAAGAEDAAAGAAAETGRGAGAGPGPPPTSPPDSGGRGA